MQRLNFAFFGFLGLVACGGRVAGNDPPSGSSGSSGVASSGGSSSGSSPTPTTGTGTAPPPPTATGMPTPASVMYTAAGYSGGLDHLTIAKADYGANTCVKIVMSAPATASSPNFVITTPKEWGITMATRADTAYQCDAKEAGPPSVTQASAGKGTIAFASAPVIPCSVSVQVALQFPSGVEVLAANNLAVDGCM